MKLMSHYRFSLHEGKSDRPVAFQNMLGASCYVAKIYEELTAALRASASIPHIADTLLRRKVVVLIWEVAQSYCRFGL